MIVYKPIGFMRRKAEIGEGSCDGVFIKIFAKFFFDFKSYSLDKRLQGFGILPSLEVVR